MSRFAFRRTALLLVAVVTVLSLWLAGTASAQGPDGRVNGQPWVNSWGGVAVYCNAANSGFAPGLNIGVGGVVVLNDSGQVVLVASRNQIDACTNRLNNNFANNGGTGAGGTNANNAGSTGNFNNGGAGGTTGTNNFNNGGMNGAGGTTGTGNFNTSGAGGTTGTGNFSNTGAGSNTRSGFNNMIISNGACIVSGVSANRLGIGNAGNNNAGNNNGGTNSANAGGTGGSNQGNFTQGATGAGNNGGTNNTNTTNTSRNVGQGGFSSIYNLFIFPDGSMQLNSIPDAEGKTFLGTWSGCK